MTKNGNQFIWKIKQYNKRDLCTKKYRDSFVGIGFGCNTDLDKAIKMAKLNAKGDLSKIIRIKVTSIVEQLNEEGSINGIPFSNNDYRSLKITISNVIIRNITFIEQSTFKNAPYFEVSIIAVKDKTEYYSDYINLTDPLMHKRLKTYFID